MVQKYQSPMRVYKHPFEIIIAAYERRFPTSELIPVFLGSDILSEYNSDDGAIQIIERRCRLKVDAPYLLKKIAGVDHVEFIQKNSLDRRNRVLHIEARNESFSSRLTINEHCQYTVHPENNQWTSFEQDASLDIKSFFGFESVVEKIAIKQYTENVQKGKEVLEHFIAELLAEGVTHIPQWRSPSMTESTSEDRASLALPEASGRDRRGSCNLEADYIHKYLGNLNLNEESQLVQLKRTLEETHKGKLPKDAHMLRFLQARDFHLERTLQMINRSLAWRKRYQIDQLVKEYSTPGIITEYYSGGWYGNDKDGRPLYILRLGQMDVKGLMKSVGEEALQKHIFYELESGLQKCEQATLRYGRPITNCVCLVDLDGLSMRHLWRPGVRALMRTIDTIQSNYPETMYQLLMVRAPRVFPVLWTLICPFIDENTSKKFLVYGGREYEKKLQDFITVEFIPDFLGGNCICNIPAGGLVPKNLYNNEEETSNNIYQTSYVVRDFNHEVALTIIQRNCVITWDFDVLKGEVVFTLLRCRHGSLSLSPHEHHMSGTVISTQYIPKHWTVGPDLVVCEPAVLCQEGDSVQGSHVCTQPAIYLLQWRHFESRSQSIFSHKSKVMYCTEVLQSESFRGSMSSLQSASSAFGHINNGVLMPAMTHEDIREDSMEGLNKCVVDRMPLRPSSCSKATTSKARSTTSKASLASQPQSSTSTAP